MLFRSVRYLYALGDFDDEVLIGRTIDFAFSSEVKSQNAPCLIARAIAGRDHGQLAWSLLKARWDEAVECFPASTIVRMLDPIKFLDRPELVRDTRAFFATHPVPHGEKTLAQILERQQVNAVLRERETPVLTASLGGG